MTDLINRLRLFLGIVWRPVTGPCRDEPPMTDWQVWWTYGLSVRTAWAVAFWRETK
jgi:hypothetical protein